VRAYKGFLDELQQVLGILEIMTKWAVVFGAVGVWNLLQIHADHSDFRYKFQFD